MKRRGTWGARVATAACLAAVAAASAADPIQFGTQAGVQTTLYGRIECDGIWNDQPTDTSAAPGGSLLVLPQTPGAKAQPETQLSSAITRLGLDLQGPSAAGLSLSAKVEADFWGQDQATPSPLLRLRYAWVRLDAGKLGRLLAGQADDLINAAAPPTLDPFVLWFSGHLGFRRPQVRLERDFDLGSGLRAGGALALAQPNGSGAFSGVWSATGYNDAGTASPVPDAQARLSLAAPGWVRGKEWKLGVAALYGQARLATDALNDARIVEEKGFSADAQGNLAEGTSLSGQLWTGQDLGDYFGNIGQNYVVTPVVASSFAVQGWGGWAALTQRLAEGWTLSAGCGQDRVDNRGLAAGTPTSNGTVFLNVAYYPLPSTKVGLEYRHQASSFAGLGSTTLDGGQCSLVYSF